MAAGRGPVSDRPRFFVFATMPICGPFTMAVFASHALHADYAIPIKQRYDIYFAYDLLDTLQARERRLLD